MTKKKKLLIAVGAVLVAALAAAAWLFFGGAAGNDAISSLTSEDCLEYTLDGEKGAFITVGIISGGKSSFKVYGENASEAEPVPHTYEIGSLTKTLTASLVQRALSEGRLSLDDSIDRYLTLPEKPHYPTIKELLTHTSGYPEYYFESEMIGNFFAGRNSFNGISGEKLLERIGKADIPDTEHGFEYSNFGYAVLGLVLESVYEEDYTSLMNGYLRELGMESSHISDGQGDLGNYWDWQAGDAYMAAGAVMSDINDMLIYAGLVLNGERGFGECTGGIKAINAQRNGIRIDEIGMAWIIDRQSGMIWHNGGTSGYNSFLGVNKEKGTAVVVLSNMPPSKKIPATMIGMKLLEEIE